MNSFFGKKPPAVKAKNLVVDTDFSKDEIMSLFEFTSCLKRMKLERKKHAYLEGLTLGMIFEKSSTRTRVSFEVGIHDLGGHGLFLSKDDIQLGRGETIPDTAKVLSRYVDGIMIRTFEQRKVEELAEFSSIPVINGLSDSYHPCQALADYFTIYERTGSFNGVKLAYVGDANNVANSLLLTGSILGADVTIASPKGYSIDKDIFEKAKGISDKSCSKIEVTENIDEAVRGANYIYTDVWTSMGQEKEALKRKKAFAKFKITLPLLKKCAPGVKVMHCLPAHRGEEIDGDVMDSDSSIIFDQAENRLHVQKAVMCSLMGK